MRRQARPTPIRLKGSRPGPVFRILALALAAGAATGQVIYHPEVIGNSSPGTNTAFVRMRDLEATSDWEAILKAAIEGEAGKR
jgi:hypothetical protein